MGEKNPTFPTGLPIMHNLIITTLLFLSICVCSLALENFFHMRKIKVTTASKTDVVYLRLTVLLKGL